MSSPPTNMGAIVLEHRARITVKETTYRTPGPRQLLIRNHAVAMNPIDVFIQNTDYVKAHMQYPVLFGEDLAGEVVAIGQGVEGFEVGMRVLAHPRGWHTSDNAQGAYQNYVLAPATMTAPIPEHLTFEEAAVLPVGIATAAAGLYQKDFLALDLPKVTTTPGSKGEVVVVWGGSSSVGGSAVQLLKHSGYEVFATASAHNLSHVESLGATKAFDYNSPGVVDDILRALEGKKLAGCYDAISKPSTIADMVRIARASEGGKKMVASTDPTQASADGDVTIKGILAFTIADNEVGPAVFRDFLPEALARKSMLAKPDPIIVGEGLEKVQEGIDRLKGGVSAGKFVVTL